MCNTKVDVQKPAEATAVASGDPAVKAKLHVPKLHIISEGVKSDSLLIDEAPLPILGTHDSRHLG